jgi:hypothetical protein
MASGNARRLRAPAIRLGSMAPPTGALLQCGKNAVARRHCLDNSSSPLSHIGLFGASGRRLRDHFSTNAFSITYWPLALLLPSIQPSAVNHAL